MAATSLGIGDLEGLRRAAAADMQMAGAGGLLGQPMPPNAPGPESLENSTGPQVMRAAVNRINES
jgi:hypothetical protein